MLSLFPIWLLLVLILLGLGNLYGILLRRTCLAEDFGFFEYTWAGFVVLVAFLEVGSLLLPINEVFFTVVAIFAAFGLGLKIYQGRKWPASPRRQAEHRPKRLLYALLICGFSVWCAYGNSRPLIWPDTPIYHFNAVKWAREFPVVPGLVNLHNRLAFNNGFHLFAAFTEIGPWIDRSRHVAFSFLTALSFATLSWLAFSAKNSRAQRIFAAFCLPYILFLSCSDEASSLTTDGSAGTIFVVAVAYMLAQKPSRAGLVFAMALVAGVFKQSLLPVAAFSFAHLCVSRRTNDALTWRKFKAFSLELMPLLILPTVISCGYVLRGIILSGRLLYPYPAIDLHLPWTEPLWRTKDAYNSILFFARNPHGISDADILESGFWHWFEPWLLRNLHSQYGRFDIYLFVVAACSVVVGFYANWKKVRRLGSGFGIAFVMTLFCIAFWLHSAPAFRFGSFYGWTLSGLGAVALIIESKKWTWFLAALQFAFGVWLSWVFQGQFSVQQVYADQAEFPWYRYEPDPAPDGQQLSTFQIPGGFIGIYGPGKGGACGNSPLPCNSNPKPLPMRRPGDLSAGFLPEPGDHK